MKFISLFLEKKAEGEEAPKEGEPKQESVKEEKEEEVPMNPDGTPMVPVTESSTGGQTNKAMDDNRPSSSIKVNDIKAAVQEALVAGSGEKILSFVKALASQQPEAINEVVKIIKVELHSSFMNKQIDEESALKISDGLNALLDGGKEDE